MTLGKHKNTKHVLQFCTHSYVKCLTIIDLLKHKLTEHAEEELESDQKQTQEIDKINKVIIVRLICKTCEVVLTEEDYVNNNEDKHTCPYLYMHQFLTCEWLDPASDGLHCTGSS